MLGQAVMPPEVSPTRPGLMRRGKWSGSSCAIELLKSADRQDLAGFEFAVIAHFGSPQPCRISQCARLRFQIATVRTGQLGRPMPISVFTDVFLFAVSSGGVAIFPFSIKVLCEVAAAVFFCVL